MSHLSDRRDLTNNMTATAYNPFTLNAFGLSAISKTGVTKLGLAEGHDILENDTSTGNNSLNMLGFEMADQTGTAKDPNLVIEHNSATAGDATTYGAKIENGDFRHYEFVDGRYWEVTDKFGTVYRFGTSSPARQYDPDDTDHIYRWMLEEVRDRNGNYISYTYYRHHNQLYPATITYTGNGTTAGIYTIDFSRESRSDTPNSYKAGFEISSQFRINQILVSVNGSWVRKYDIAYTNGDNGGRSMISSITETGRDEQGTTLALPASTMSYQVQSGGGWLTTAGWTVPTAFTRTFSVSGVDNGARVADFNGDSLADIAQYREDEGSGKIFINNGDGTWSTTTPSGIDAFATQAGNDTGVRIADVNGDGRADLVRQFGDSVLLNTNAGASFTATAWSLPHDFIDDGTSRHDLGTRLVDVNGDGLADVVHYYTGESKGSVWLNTGSGWTEAPTWSLPTPIAVSFGGVSGVDAGVRFDDFNDDGLVDIAHGRSGGSGDEKLDIIGFNQS